MDTKLLTPETGVRPCFRAFTLYVDFAAGVRAKRLARDIQTFAGSELQVRSEMWKLDSVFPPGPIRTMIAREAGESDVLIIAASCPEQPDPEVINWLELLVHCKAGRPCPGLLIGLLGDEEHVVNPMNWLVNELAAFARETRMHWRWQTGAREMWEGTHWLRDPLNRVFEEKKATAGFEVLPDGFIDAIERG